MKNAFTVDLEDWFCSHNLRRVVRFEEWGQYDLRIVASTRHLLELLDCNHTLATFFVLGWIAEQVPELINEIEAKGHEIATHGYSHSLLTELTPDAFRLDLEHALDATAKLVRTPIRGFRAPAFTLTPATLWALEILPEFGIEYDSSVFPVSMHPDYGLPSARQSIHVHPNGIVEVPLSSISVGNARVPCSGGGYFRLLPYSVFRQLVRVCRRQGRPLIFYVHPWEVDPDLPRLSVGRVEKFRHYNHLDVTRERLRRLLLDFEFTSIKELLKKREIETPFCNRTICP